MNLRNELKLPNAKIVDLTKYPRSPEPSRVLVLVCPLKPTIAEVLKCRDMCYDINDNPRHFEGGFGLDYELADCEIKLARSNGALVPLAPRVIKKFRIGHDAKENLTLTLRVHFVGYGSALEEWSDDINDKDFDAAILSLQGELFPVEDPATTKKKDGPAGGTRVEMSTGGSPSAADEMTANVARAEHGPIADDEITAEFGPEDGPCTSCNNRIPFEDSEKTLHATGQKCARSAGATLASASVAGGTHQRRGRKRLEVPEQQEDHASEEPEETLVN